jgi:hypothetical protein
MRARDMTAWALITLHYQYGCTQLPRLTLLDGCATMCMWHQPDGMANLDLKGAVFSSDRHISYHMIYMADNWSVTPMRRNSLPSIAFDAPTETCHNSLHP